MGNMTINKTNACHDPNMSAEDTQELKAKFQKLAATAEELANAFAQLESNIRSFQNDVISEAEKVMKKGPNTRI